MNGIKLQIVPISVDADGVVINGSTRLLAARHLKLEQVPVVLPQPLRESKRLSDDLEPMHSGESQ